LYDNITEDAFDRHKNIYDRNGKELVDIYKMSNEPVNGVKVLIQYKDAEGVVFDAKDYATYSSGTESYLDYAVNRSNTPQGVMVEFPITPWPAKQDLLSYLKGGTMAFNVLDTASLHREVYTNKKYPFLNDWPLDSWGASKWYIRLRSKVLFNESGTWVISWCAFAPPRWALAGHPMEWRSTQGVMMNTVNETAAMFVQQCWSAHLPRWPRAGRPKIRKR